MLGPFLSDQGQYFWSMKFSRKQFRTAMALLARLPGRLLALPLQAFYGRPKAATRRAQLQAGPGLADWRRFHWVPLFESVHPTAQRLIVAARQQELLTLRYWGGSTPGVARCVLPRLVFQAGGCGPLYVSGYCHLRRAERVFRVERMELLLGDGNVICITE